MIIKVCGITNLADATYARDVGVDLVGVNLVGGPRRVSVETAQAIIGGLDDPACAVVLLHVSAGTDWLGDAEALARAGAGYVQLYGAVDSPTLHEVRRLGLRSIWVYHVPTSGAADELPEQMAAFGKLRPDYVLLDARDPARLGGTGKTIDRFALAASLDSCRSSLPPILLAGGLTPANVAAAIAKVAPAGVDTSSGVEASPGRKDAEKLRAFVARVRSADEPPARAPRTNPPA